METSFAGFPSEPVSEVLSLIRVRNPCRRGRKTGESAVRLTVTSRWRTSTKDSASGYGIPCGGAPERPERSGRGESPDGLRVPVSEAGAVRCGEPPERRFYGRLFRTDMLVHDACANIVRIDRRLSDRGRGGAERIHGMTARRDTMTARSDARDSVPDNGTGGNRQKTG